MFPSFIVFNLTSDKIFSLRSEKDILNMIIKDMKINKYITSSVDLTLARQAEEGETDIIKNTILEMMEKIQPMEISNSMDSLKLAVWIYGALKSKLI